MRQRNARGSEGAEDRAFILSRLPASRTMHSEQMWLQLKCHAVSWYPEVGQWLQSSR